MWNERWLSHSCVRHTYLEGSHQILRVFFRSSETQNRANVKPPPSNIHTNESTFTAAKMASQEGTANGSLFSRSTLKDLPGQFPPPVIVPPKEEHRHTFVILHGRGSTAEKFGPSLLECLTTSGEKLQEAFPHAKLIFLTAPKTRATIYKRSYTHQWFDMWHMEERFKRQDLVRDGLEKVSIALSSPLNQC